MSSVRRREGGMRGSVVVVALAILVGITDAWVHQRITKSSRSASLASLRRLRRGVVGAGSSRERGVASASAAADDEGGDLVDLVTPEAGGEQSALASRLAGGFGPTVWSEFGALAMELGDSVVNLGQGFPDFAPPAFVREAAMTAVESDCHQYTRPAGHPPLVKLLAERYSKHLDRPVDAMKEVAVTVGCSQALYVTMQCLVRPGDEVVLLEPFFDLYIGQIRMAGGVPRYVPLRATSKTAGDLNDGENDDDSAGGSGWQLDFDLLEATVNEKTRALVLNSPHNPTGKVFSRADMERIAALVRKWPQLTVVSDEVYKYTVHGASATDGHCHFAGLPGMFDRTLTLSSAGKTFSVTGWQVGWIVGPERLLRDVHIALPFLQFCASTPMQQALVGVLTRADEPFGGEPSYYDWLCSQYRRKATALAAALETAGLPVVPSEGGYFLTVDVADVDVPQRYLEETSDAIDTVTKDWAFCRWLAIEHGVLSIPVAPFFSAERRAAAAASSSSSSSSSETGEGAGAYARFAFCKSDKTLELAAERLALLGEKTRGGAKQREGAVDSAKPEPTPAPAAETAGAAR